MTVVEVWMKCCGNIGINFPVESGTKIVLTSCITWFYHLSLGKKVDNLLSKTFFSAWHCTASLKTSSLSWAHCVMCCAKSSGEGDVGCEGTSLRRQIKRRLCGRSPSFPALTFCSCLTCEVCWRCKGRLASPLEEWSAQSPMVVPNFLSFSSLIDHIDVTWNEENYKCWSLWNLVFSSRSSQPPGFNASWSEVELI